MKLKILLIGLLFMNCTNQAQEQVLTYEISEVLKPYVFDYLSTLERYDIQYYKQSFIVVFDADIMNTSLVGQAKGMFNDRLIYVKINPKIWGELTHKQKRHLIFHELSHDMFNIRHTMKVELMRPSMPSPSQSFAMDIDKRIDELMKHIKNGKRKIQR